MTRAISPSSLRYLKIHKSGGGYVVTITSERWVKVEVDITEKMFRRILGLLPEDIRELINE